VKFEFDYHLLKRWLLKMAFNSARIHSSADVFVYAPLRNYLRGSANVEGRSVYLYLQLSYPGVVPIARLADPQLQDAPAVWKPQNHRVGLMNFEVPGLGRKILRVIHLRSYSFFLAFFEPGMKRSVATDFSNAFLASMRGMVLLRPSQPRINLLCNGADAWRSFDGARENALVAADR
jgi:hypothetical protein